MKNIMQHIVPRKQLQRKTQRSSEVSACIYDAGGDRTYKLTWDGKVHTVNGRREVYYIPQSATLYASPYLVATPQGYTKHYYAEAERITSQLGRGRFADVGTPVVDDSLVQAKLQAVTGNVRYPVTLTAPSSSYFSYLDTLTNRQNATLEAYWYHPDHLGSSSWITYTDGDAVQHLHYLPFGENFVDQKSSSFDGVRYTFSAKERDTETGYSYFGSRYYNSDLSIWLSVDPQASKYPSLSPYVYCANNPVRLVDPNGEDIWEIDENGKLTWKERNDEVDILHATKTRQSMEFKIGTIKEMTPAKGSANHPIDGNFSYDYSYIDIDNDDLADCFFEFVAENTNVEWSHTKYSENGNRIATTTNMPYELADPTGMKITYDFIKEGIKVRESNHSHPFIEGRNINPKPSGGDDFSKYLLINFCKEHNYSVPTTKVYGKVDGNWKYTPY